MQDDILDLINEEFETGYELDTPAAAVLDSSGPALRRQSSKGAGGAGGGGTWASLLGGNDLVSSDTGDDDYRSVWRPQTLDPNTRPDWQGLGRHIGLLRHGRRRLQMRVAASNPKPLNR